MASSPVTAAARAALSPTVLLLPLRRGIRMVLFLLARASPRRAGAVRDEWGGVREQVL
ncbi:hypothetical protein [Streptomyces luteogriseus]|uniref:hypothetical protein n=1 Tax=Streptomyces luteogriseus TaxID=68233 RepID=UPI0037936F57